MARPAHQTNEPIAREILGRIRYVVLATADERGRPWATPVWFAHHAADETDGADGGSASALYWVSDPGARHSVNLAGRAELSMVVFDTTAAPLAGQGVYLSGTARVLTDRRAVEHGVAVFSAESVRQGGASWTAERVTGGARLRLYRAVVEEAWILDPDSPVDERVRVQL